MLPDEKLQQREKEKISKLANSPDITISANTYPFSELSVRSDLLNRNGLMPQQQIDLRTNRMLIRSDNFNLLKRSEEDNERFFKYASSPASSISPEKSIIVDDNDNETAPRSAFSKVTQIVNVDSPIPSMSPDQLSCSSSSPPISCSPPNPGNNLYSNFRTDYPSFINGSAFQAISQSQRFSSPNKNKNLIYHINPQNMQPSNGEPHHPHGYLPSSFPFANGTHPLMGQPEQFIRNPTAAALLSTLLPSSLGSFSLPAQNVCAKCNISFRMTSDLVYHMRSHHKNEFTADPNRRKREEKLKCPVCSESFRERHHLTRHMTAHQDKEGDLLDSEIQEYHSRRNK
jgi:reticulon-4 receptor-like 1